ncbi:MAG: VIT and VWA domain-containing protein [Pseudomonadota bacterium]|nr:VIT and VWA domain-containing protein [Pseudomonadota bacterium]
MTAAEAIQPHLTTATGEIMPLESLAISGQIADSLAILELTQAYRNRESTNIEAIYTFPLPFDGVLLGLQATIGDQTLEGAVIPKQQAEDRYEDAITGGNSAIMLEQQSPGLYTVNLGNLLAGEDASITIRYALPLKWTGNQLRLALPLTVAPRYGLPEFGEQKPFAVPEQDFIIEYPLTVALSVIGRMSASPISSPTHQLTTQPVGDSIQIGLLGGVDHPDRDLILRFDKTEDSPNTVSTVQVDDQTFGHAVFCLPNMPRLGPLATKLLVDCSGSMAGASMAITKNAINRLLKQSRVGDQLSLTAFGSRYMHFEDGSFHTVTETGIPVQAHEWLQNLDANLGGTEMESALRSVFSLSDNETPADVLMITDGQIWDIDGVITASRNAGQRVFVIGVGLSPAESNLRALAEATGGAVEFLSPAEPINEVVDRQLNRMRQPTLTNAKLDLPGELRWMLPNPETTPLYAGDTVHFWYEFSGVEEKEQVKISLNFPDDDGIELIANAASTDENTELPRLAAAARLKAWDLKHADTKEKEIYSELAVAHQLVTPLTNFLMLHDRGEDAATDLPKTKQIKHMDRATIMLPQMAVSADMMPEFDLCESSNNYLEIPTFLRRQADGDAATQSSEAPNTHNRLINRHFDSHGSLPLTLRGAYEFADIGLDDEILIALEELISQVLSEESVLLAFWDALRKSPFRRGLKRRAIWWIKRQRKLTENERRLSQIIVTALNQSDKAHVRWDGDDIAGQVRLIWI